MAPKMSNNVIFRDLAPIHHGTDGTDPLSPIFTVLRAYNSGFQLQIPAIQN